jgi:hypothetical protein
MKSQRKSLTQELADLIIRSDAADNSRAIQELLHSD